MAQATGWQNSASTNGTKQKAHVHLQTSLPWPSAILAQRLRLQQEQYAIVYLILHPENCV